MTSQQLQSYLQQVISSEVEYQTADRAYRICQSRVKALAIPRNVPVPAPPIKKYSGDPIIIGGAAGLVVFLIMTALGCGIMYFAENYEGNSLILSLLSAFLNAFRDMPFWAGMALGLFWGIRLGKSLYDSYTKWNKEAEQQQANYKGACVQYRKAVLAEKDRMARENEMLPVVRKDAALLNERRSKARENLERFYSLDIVKPKYRNLLCIATFLEYLENERCYALTGHEGCYNLFEEEKQRGIIIARLNDISEQLNEIRKNQERAAEALEQINSNVSFLCENVAENGRKIDVMAQDQRTTAYYAEQAANDQRALNEYIMMRDWLNS